MDLSITITAIGTIVPTGLACIFSSGCARYEDKISKIRASLVGYLEIAKDDLVSYEVGRADKQSSPEEERQEYEYESFISFFRDSKLLSYANEYEDILYYESRLEFEFNRCGAVILSLIVPLIVFQFDTFLNYAVFISFVLFLYLGICLADLIRKTRRINALYKKYVIGQQSFGGYDY